MVSNYILCPLQISSGLEPFKKNQLFKFESQALYQKRPISVSIGEEWDWGMDPSDVITSEVGEVLSKGVDFLKIYFF